MINRMNRQLQRPEIDKNSLCTIGWLENSLEMSKIKYKQNRWSKQHREKKSCLLLLRETIIA